MTVVQLFSAGDFIRDTKGAKALNYIKVLLLLLLLLLLVFLFVSLFLCFILLFGDSQYLSE